MAGSVPFDSLKPTGPFADAAAWSGWLAEHADSSDGIWLLLAKKGSGIASVTYAEAVEEALCWGWIDGQRRSYDQAGFLQRFTPRRERSIWSQVNCAKGEALIAAGRMQPRGQLEIDRARADGRWDAAYAPASTIEVPDDLQAALAAHPRAAEAFAALDSRNRYSILFRLHNAKRPKTRAERLATFIAMLDAGETLHP